MKQKQLLFYTEASLNNSQLEQQLLQNFGQYKKNKRPISSNTYFQKSKSQKLDIQQQQVKRPTVTSNKPVHNLIVENSIMQNKNLQRILRTRPLNIQQDKEKMYDEIMILKRQLCDKNSFIQELNNKVYALERENAKKNQLINKIDDYVGNQLGQRQPESLMLVNYRSEILKMTDQIQKQNKELDSIKKNYKYLNVQEKEILIKQQFELISNLKFQLDKQSQKNDKRGQQNLQQKLETILQTVNDLEIETKNLKIQYQYEQDNNLELNIQLKTKERFNAILSKQLKEVKQENEIFKNKVRQMEQEISCFTQQQFEFDALKSQSIILKKTPRLVEENQELDKLNRQKELELIHLKQVVNDLKQKLEFIQNEFTMKQQILNNENMKLKSIMEDMLSQNKLLRLQSKSQLIEENKATNKSQQSVDLGLYHQEIDQHTSQYNQSQSLQISNKIFNIHTELYYDDQQHSEESQY